MNKRVHRLVFDRKRSMRVPAAEHVRSAGKAGGGQSRSVARVALWGTLASSLAAGMAWPDPADARTVGNGVPRASTSWAGRTVPDAKRFPDANGSLPFRSGQYSGLDKGGFSLNYVTDGLDVIQVDKNVVINWDSFNIGRGYTVKFVQPDKGAALNKIWDEQASVILGRISANGEVILENTNGVLFGPTARVDTQRFVATALSLSNETFLKGLRNSTTGEAIFGSNADTPHGVVSLERGAEITALAGGDVMLIAPTVYNEGRITTPGGQAILAAGQKVYLMASTDPIQRGMLVAVDAFKAPTDPEAAPLPTGVNTVEQAGAGTYFVNKAGDTVSVSAGGSTAGLSAQVNAIVAEKGSINLVGMSIRQNGVLTATTAVKGENGAIYLHAGASKRDTQTRDASGNLMMGVGSQDLGDIEFGANSLTAVNPDANVASTQKDADTFYRSRIDVQGCDIWVRSGATLRANSGDITMQALVSRTDDTYLSNNAAQRSEADPLGGDASRILIESGATIDASGLRNVALPMGRNQVSGRLFQIELADSPVQRNGVLYRQTVQFDANSAIHVANAKGFYNATQRDAQELSTQGGNVRIEGLGAVVMADGARLNISGGSVQYGSGVVQTSVLRKGDRLVSLDAAQANQRYDELISATLGSRSVEGYLQGFDAGTASIAGYRATSVGLSGLDGSVVVGPRQRNGLLTGNTRTGMKFSQPAIVATRPDLAGSLRPTGAWLNVGKLEGDTNNVNFLSALQLTPQRSASLGPLPEAGTEAADAFFAALPSLTRISTTELAHSGVSGLNLRAEKVSVLPGSSVNLGASGSLGVYAYQDIDFAGQVQAEGGTATFSSRDGNVTLAAGSRIGLSGRVLDERGVAAGSDALAVNGGSLTVSAGRSVTAEAGSAIDVSAGVWRDGLGALSKGVAGSVSLTLNTAVVTDSVNPYSGLLKLDGSLSAFDFAKGGALSLSGLRTLTIGGEAVHGGLALDPAFFSDHGFGSFNLTAAGDVVVKAGTQLKPTLKNLELAPTRGRAAPQDMVRVVTLEEGLRQGSSLSLSATEAPPSSSPSAGLVTKQGLEAGGKVMVGSQAVVDVGAGGAVSLKAGLSVDVAGSLVARGGAVSLALTGARGALASAVLPESSTDARGLIDGQEIRLRSGAKIDVSGVAHTVVGAGGKVSGDVLGGGTVKLNDNGQSGPVRGRVVTEAGSLIDVSGASAALTIGRGAATTQVSKGAGSVSVASTDGFVLAGTVNAHRPDASVSGGQFTASVSREGWGDVVNDGAPAYVATERSIVVEADAAGVAAHTARNDGLGVLSAKTLTGSGFDRIELRADDRVLLQQGANLVASPSEAAFRSVGLNSRVLEVAGAGEHVVQATHVAMGDRSLAPQAGEQAFAPVASSAGEGSLSVRAGLIEVFGHSAVRGTANTSLSATLGANNQVGTRRDGELRFIGRTFGLESTLASQSELSGSLGFDGLLTVEAGQVYASTLSSFTVQGRPGLPLDGSTDGPSKLLVNGPTAGASTSHTPLSALASLTLQAHDIEVNGTLRQPFGSITINGETTPVLGANSVLSVSGDGVTVPVGTTVNQRDWVYATAGTQGASGVLSADPTVKSLDGLSVAKSIMVKGAGLSIDARSQIQAQGGGDLLAAEFVAGVGGSADTTARKNVYAVLPDYSHDFAPYDTQIRATANQVGTGLTAGDQIEVRTGNGVLAPGRYTLLPASYAVLPGAVLVSQTTLAAGQTLKQAQVQDDGSVIVSGQKTALGTTIDGGHDTRLALLLEPQATFRAKSDIAATSINALLGKLPAGSVSRPGDAGRVSLQASDAPFSWEAQYQLQGVGGFAGGQFDLAMPSVTVVADGAASGVGDGAVSAAALKATGADSVLLGGVRAGTAEHTRLSATAATVQVKANVAVGGELILVAQDTVAVADQVSISSTGAASSQVNALTVVGEGAALVVSNRVLTDLTRDLAGVAATPADKALALGQGATLSGGAVQLDSSGQVQRGEALTVHTSALGLGSGRIAVGGDSGEPKAFVLPGELLNAVSRLQLRGYEGIDLVGNVTLGALNAAGQPRLQELVLDSRLVRGVSTGVEASAQKAMVQAQHVTLRNTSGLAADTAAVGGTSLTVMAQPAVADATAEGITVGAGAQALAFHKAELASTGDVVLRGQGSVSAQGDLLLNAARLTAAGQAQVTLGSNTTLTVASIGQAKLDGSAQVAASRTLGDVVGAGAKVNLNGQRVVQSGVVDLPSGQLSITGRGDAGQRDTIVFDAGSVTQAAGWVAPAGSTWSAVASAGSIQATALQGDIVLKGTLDVSAPASTTVGVASGVAGSITLQATQAGAAVVLGDKAQLRGSAAQGSDSGRITVDASRLVREADRAQSVAQAQSALNDLVKLGNDGGFHREVDLRIREGDQALSTGLSAARVLISADGGQLALGDGAVIDARAARGGMVQLSAKGDVAVTGTASIDASSSAAGANGGDVLLASSEGMVKVASSASITATGDDVADGRIVLRARLSSATGGGAEILKVQAAGAALHAGEVTAEAVKVFTDASSVAYATKTVAGKTTASLVVGGQDVLTYLSGIKQANMGALKAGLGWADLGSAFHVRSGIEVQTAGDFNLNADWNLASARPGAEPIALTVRAAGNVNLNGSLSDGFATATRAADTATAPTALLAGDGASYRLVAGADMGAANVLKTRGSATGNLTVAASKMVRTTSGSIELAAAQDVVLKAGTGATPAQGVVYVAGKMAADPLGRVAASRSAWEQFTQHGGRLEVSAGRDVLSPAASQLFTNWFLHTGPTAATVTWWTAFDSFKQGLGSMGGNNLRVVASRDIRNLGVVAPTTARTVQDADTGAYSQVVDNGGDVLVRAQGNMAGGTYLLGRGQGRIEAGGSVSTGDALNEALVPKAGLMMGLMDGQWSVLAQGDVAVAAAFNPTLIESQSKRTTGQAGSYATYGDDAAVSVLSTAGRITWGNGAAMSLGTGLFNLNKTYATANEKTTFVASGAQSQIDTILRVAPPTLALSAFEGDVNVGSLTLFPSAKGNLTVLAGQDVNLTATSAIKNLVVSGADTASWDAYTASRPAGGTTTSTKLGNLLNAGLIQLDTVTGSALHADDAVPVRIHAGQDLHFLGNASLNLAKAADLSAEGDIVHPDLRGEQFHASDITRVVAGGDIVGANNAPSAIRSFGLIQLGGPGQLQVEAGGNMDLATSAGIETVGNLYNTALPPESAAIRVAAGMARTVDVPAFEAAFLASNPQARRQLVQYVAQTLGLDAQTLSESQALSYFAQLTPAHQVDFADRKVVLARFASAYVTPSASGQNTDAVWAFLARQAGLDSADHSTSLYAEYTRAQQALVSHVQGVTGMEGLAYADALSRYRAMSDADKAALIDQKATLSPTMVAAFLVATDDAPYAALWQARVQAASANLPSGAARPSADDHSSALFQQFRDEVLMSELKRLGSAASGVADSANALYNPRRQAVRDQFWSLASQSADLAGMGVGFVSTGDINLAGSKVFTRGTGDFAHSGIDLFAPGGQVLVGFSSQSATDKLQASTRGLVSNGGSIRSFSRGDFQVNAQKTFVIGEGDLLVYSAQGNIDSGRGSNTDIAVPDKVITRSPTGEVLVSTPPPINGSGIGIVKSSRGTFSGKVSLLAPKGEVRALDAFIQGPEVIVPGKVLGADNLQGSVKGQAAAPAVTVALSVNTGLGTEAAAGEGKQEAVSKREKTRDASSVLTVDLLGMGDVAAPAAGPAERQPERDCTAKPTACTGQ